MTENYKIIGSFIKDMSSETPDTPTYIFVRDKISKYRLNIDINSKAVKNGIIEVNTILKFSDQPEILKKVSTKQNTNNKKQDFINGEFEDIEDENDRKL